MHHPRRSDPQIVALKSDLFFVQQSIGHHQRDLHCANLLLLGFRVYFVFFGFPHERYLFENVSTASKRCSAD